MVVGEATQLHIHFRWVCSHHLRLNGRRAGGDVPSLPTHIRLWRPSRLRGPSKRAAGVLGALTTGSVTVSITANANRLQTAPDQLKAGAAW